MPKNQEADVVEEKTEKGNDPPDRDSPPPEKSYYYDDAHGYEDYDPEEEEGQT